MEKTIYVKEILKSGKSALVVEYDGAEETERTIMLDIEKWFYGVTPIVGAFYVTSQDTKYERTRIVNKVIEDKDDEQYVSIDDLKPESNEMIMPNLDADEITEQLEAITNADIVFVDSIKPKAAACL